MASDDNPWIIPRVGLDLARGSELCLNSNFNHELSNEKHFVITNLTLTYILL
jgi:hypothetical protein